MQWRRLRSDPGDRFGYAIIVRQIGDWDHDATQYEIRKACCGTRGVITRHGLLDLRKRNTARCLKCRNLHRTGRGSHWTEPETAILRERFWAGQSDEAISEALAAAGYERTENSVSIRRTKLGLVFADRVDAGVTESLRPRRLSQVAIPAPTGPGVFVNGQWWPSLIGPMGPRHDVTGRHN